MGGGAPGGGGPGSGRFRLRLLGRVRRSVRRFHGRPARGGGRGARSRGSDLRYNLAITLEEAYSGLQKQINVPTAVTCAACRAPARGRAEPVTCPTCSGMGKVRAQQGFFTVERTCPTCSGRGQIVKNPCKACGGAGRVQKDRALNVNIPAGVETGTRIRLPARARPVCAADRRAISTSSSSLEEHRSSSAMAWTSTAASRPMTAPRWAAKSRCRPSMAGARVKVPEGSQSGRQMRLRGKGMPALRGTGMGDMYIELAVETPVNLTRNRRSSCASSRKAAPSRTTPTQAASSTRSASSGTIWRADNRVAETSPRPFANAGGLLCSCVWLTGVCTGVCTAICTGCGPPKSNCRFNPEDRLCRLS
jgi:molecular chaperone DnaJ